MRQALPHRPSRPKTLTGRMACTVGASNRGRSGSLFQAGCRRCSDVTKPRFSVGVSNRLLKGVLKHRAFSGLAALCHGGRWGCQAGGGNGCSKGPGGAVVGRWWGLGGVARALPRPRKQRQRVGVACVRRWHAPKKTPARGRAESCCQTGPLREVKRVPNEGEWAV